MSCLPPPLVCAPWRVKNPRRRSSGRLGGDGRGLLRFDEKPQGVLSGRAGHVAARPDAEDRREYPLLAQAFRQVGTVANVLVDLEVNETVKGNREAGAAFDLHA